jgi:NDP-sugar pyrophosphorylase family protein
MKAMIFAAGLGTRLKPLTDTMPKALVPVGGRPLLEILMRRLIDAGIGEVVINIHHFANQIVDFVERNKAFGVKVSFSDERAELLETGGGIKKAEPLLRGDGVRGQELYLIHNVDILSNMDLRAFCQMGRDMQQFDPDLGALLLVSDRPTSRYLLFDDGNRLVGWTNRRTGEVKSPYKDLNPADCRQYAFAGIHLFSSVLFPFMASWPEKFSIIDFYLSVCDKVRIMGHPQEGLELLDVGKQDTLTRAEAFLEGNM